MLENVPPTLPPQGPVAVYGSIQFDLSSKIADRIYRIFVFKPQIPPPPTGFPVVVVTDGNMTFPLMATVDATFALTGMAALVVGVGYATEDPMSLFSRRNRDLTPPTPLSSIEQRPGQARAKLEDYGGSEFFYRFLMEELRPLIASAYSVDPNNQTLYGHSIGGMFTVSVLLNHPESFRNFVASSPSIFWNHCSVLSDLPSFTRKVQARAVAPRVLISVGSEEQAVPTPLPPAMTKAIVEKMPKVPSALRNIIAKIFIKKKMLEWRMVDNARDLAKGLQKIKGASDYEVRFHAFEGEDHLTALPASVGRALAFVLEP
jgi:predicted alpha/beta superfamily hydrolase